MKANTPIPIWKRTALVTFMEQRCSAEILEAAQFLSSAPHLLAGFIRCFIALPVAPMEVSLTKELQSIAKATYTARQLRAGQVAVKAAVGWFTS